VRVPGGDWEEVPQAAWRVQARHHADSLPLALALALDHSGSMGELRARLLQDAIDSVLAAKRPADALSILKFDSRMGIEAPLGTNAQALRKQFRKDGLGQYGGSTAWMQAALDAMGLLAPAGGQYAEKAVVLFTDGQDNSSAPTAAEVAREARARGIRLYAVGFGASVDTLVLRRLATATGGQYYHIYQTPDLLRIFRDVYRRLNSHYTVWLPAGQAGPQEVSVELCLPGGEASLRAVVWGKGQEGGFEAMRELERLPLPEERPGFHKAPEVGDTLLLRVHFLFDRVEFADSASWKAVEEAAAYLRRYPEVRVALCGHTDDQGGDGYNIKLSMDRALAIKGLLVDRGIAADRLEAMGYGASKPVAANDTEAGRAANRRTELLVLPPGRVP
jgi:outer membrane protein OmpA-like peptidoglycan-associated protein